MAPALRPWDLPTPPQVPSAADGALRVTCAREDPGKGSQGGLSPRSQVREWLSGTARRSPTVEVSELEARAALSLPGATRVPFDGTPRASRLSNHSMLLQMGYTESRVQALYAEPTRGFLPVGEGEGGRRGSVVRRSLAGRPP